MGNIPTTVAEYGVFIDTAFNQVACIGTATKLSNHCFVFNLVARPADGTPLYVTPVNPPAPVLPLRRVK